MFVHFINNKPVGIAEINLFSSERFSEFRNMLSRKGLQWENNFKVVDENTFEFTVSQTKLFTSHENFDTKYYDLINWLSGDNTNRDITKNFN
jgi:hypothetical protein